MIVCMGVKASSSEVSTLNGRQNVSRVDIPQSEGGRRPTTLGSIREKKRWPWEMS